MPEKALRVLIGRKSIQIHNCYQFTPRDLTYFRSQEKFKYFFIFSIFSHFFMFSSNCRITLLF